METPISQEQINILLVDDRPENLVALEAELAPLGHNLVSVNSGKAALRETLARDFAIIILDVVMPEMDGYETARMLKTRAKTQNIPIIFVTASGEEPVKGYTVGAVDYISKPFNPEILRAKVRVFAELYKARRDLAASILEIETARDELELRVTERTLTLFNEIEERIKTEEALRESQNELSRAQQIAHLGSWERHLQTRKQTCSDELYRIYGFEPGAFEPAFDKFMECVHPEDRKIIEAYYPEILSGKLPRVELDYRIIRQDGEERIVHDKLEVITDKDGKPVKVIGVTYDITERKLLEESLRESEARHRAIMETANDAMICINPDGKVHMWNRKAEEIFGYTAQEANGKDVHELIVPVKYREQARVGLAKFSATGTGPVINKTTEIAALYGNGSEFPIELSIAPVRMKGGWGASAIIRDITDRKRREQELNELNQHLQHALDDITVKQKMLIRSEKLAALGQISAGVAHEIKNPLNIIYTSTQLMMMEEGLPAALAESGKIIMEQVMRAVKIIDNLRDFARERKPETKEIDLCPFIEKTMGLVAYEMKGEGIEIEKDCPPESIRIMGDVDQLAQVFLNITNNARDSLNMKKKSYSFEEAEKIGWRARLAVRTLVEEGKAKISFEDNGVGISEEDKKKLFTPFFTTKGEAKGTGLGIAIALGIIENHGGTIEFESEEGKGAVFTVTIPLAG